MKLRMKAVPVGNEIKKIPNDTWHLFIISTSVICVTISTSEEDVTIRC